MVLLLAYAADVNDVEGLGYYIRAQKSANWFSDDLAEGMVRVEKDMERVGRTADESFSEHSKRTPAR